MIGLKLLVLVALVVGVALMAEAVVLAVLLARDKDIREK